MEQKKINLRFSVLCAMILLAAFSRIIPHMPNFSPLGAIGLFGAAYFAKKMASVFNSHCSNLVKRFVYQQCDLCTVLPEIHLVLSGFLLAIWKLSFNCICRNFYFQKNKSAKSNCRSININRYFLFGFKFWQLDW
jgi:hypothetical protein